MEVVFVFDAQRRCPLYEHRSHLRWITRSVYFHDLLVAEIHTNRYCSGKKNERQVEPPRRSRAWRMLLDWIIPTADFLMLSDLIKLFLQLIELLFQLFLLVAHFLSLAFQR